jgi:hypothetical protein
MDDEREDTQEMEEAAPAASVDVRKHCSGSRVLTAFPYAITRDAETDLTSMLASSDVDTPAQEQTIQYVSACKDLSGLKTTELKFRRPLYHPDFPFVIFWSQKSACTTIVKWFFLQIGVLEKALKYSSWIHDYEFAEFKRRPGYQEDLYRALKDEKPVVKFVRDPYARSYSSYLDLVGRGGKSNKMENHWGTEVRRQIIQGLVGDLSAQDYTFSFRQYLRWLVAQRMNTMNVHIRPQHVARDDFFNMRLCRIESLEQNLIALEREFNLPHSIADHREILTSRHYHTKAKSFNLNASRALLDLCIPPQRSSDFPHVKFTRAVAEGTEFDDLIHQCFGRDIEVYGY